MEMIGYLVPLDANLEVDFSIPRISISVGANSIGRSSIPGVQDKRLSRKHLTLTASFDGSAILHLEGINPVVINSGGLIKKLSFGETSPIYNGDILELIPGLYSFKYVTPSSPRDADTSGETMKRKTSDGRETVESDLSTCKKQHGNPEADQNHSCKLEIDESEGIRKFRAPDENFSRTFRLLRVHGLPDWANTSCVSITDVLQGDIIVAILSNYMVDMDWLLTSCPLLKTVPHVMVIHGEDGASLEAMKRSKPSTWILHKPSLPIPFGTHHSKAIILVYPRGVRVVIHTANLIHVDWNNKTQGLWIQDFPWKDQSTFTKTCGFETDLIDYLNALKWPRFTVGIPGIGEVNITPSFFQKFDFSEASVRLVASVPGYHNGSNLSKWGHMKLRSILQECTFDNEFKNSPLIYQFSSLGSLDEKWMSELAFSMSTGRANDKAPLGLGNPMIIWPTVEDVRCSLEGYAAGNAIPSPMKNVEKNFLKKYWAKWRAPHTGRCRAMPHIKTFCRYSGQNIAWFLLTSSNLSKAAWGTLQKNNSQLMIRSYELGVLFLPNPSKSTVPAFSCTETQAAAKHVAGPDGPTKMVTLEGIGAAHSRTVTPLPIPYELPPAPYSPEDVPWSWDRRYAEKDVYGHVWPRVAF